jgi:HEAT repeat protein
MGDQRGIAALKEACASADKPSNKVTAAQYLLMLNDESCLEEIVEMIESKADSDQPQYAISVLPSFHNPPKELAYRIRQIMINALSDSSPTVRITAAIAIKQLHDAAFLPYLREAMNREEDETVKGRLTEAMQTLETKREK